MIEKLNCSIGITAYNEEKHIKKLLESILKQKLMEVNIKEIIVVASGCTDNTEEIVKSFCAKYHFIKLITESQRKGKYSAINIILKEAKSPIIVICSADIILERNAIENLVKVFKNPKVGMSGPRIVPLNSWDSPLGFTVNFLWDLHHRISIQDPKLGELIAFRKDLVKKLPPTSVDEATLEILIREQGYQLKYVPSAHVFNEGPRSFKDFLIQRRRIACGHLHLKRKYGYAVSTFKITNVLNAVFCSIPKYKNRLLYIIIAIILEILAKFLGFWDYYFNRNKHIIWKRISY